MAKTKVTLTLTETHQLAVPAGKEYFIKALNIGDFKVNVNDATVSPIDNMEVPISSKDYLNSNAFPLDVGEGLWIKLDSVHRPIDIVIYYW